MILTTNYINNIKNQYSNTDQWPLLYPWFSIGYLLETANNVHAPSFQQLSQKTAIYFNDIHRLHWLLHHQEIDINKITSTVVGLDKNITPVINEPAVEHLHEADTEQQQEDRFKKDSSISQSLAEASKQFKEKHITEDENLIFESEPYHTVDYFASQGIKLEQEPKADDKFGQQLKSFTSWLKQMKRLPTAKIAEKNLDPVVEDIASDSLKQGDVLTESMAEVLLRQGKIAQAIEVWQKLSLLYPEKSHYFASLIEKQKFKK